MSEQITDVEPSVSTASRFLTTQFLLASRLAVRDKQTCQKGREAQLGAQSLLLVLLPFSHSAGSRDSSHCVRTQHPAAKPMIFLPQCFFQPVLATWDASPIAPDERS